MADVQSKQQPQQEPKGLTRIPVSRIWFRESETMDLPGGNSIMGRVDCEPAKVAGRQYFVAHFIPAHQVIELEWYRNEKAEPHLMRLPVSSLKRFD